MTANAVKDRQTETSMMAPVANRVAESMLQIMQTFGIKKMSGTKLKSASYERIVATPVFFPNTPPEVTQCGLLVKDDIMRILASAGILQLEIVSTEEEDAQMAKGYSVLVDSWKSASKPDEEKSKEPEKAPEGNGSSEEHA